MDFMDAAFGLVQFGWKVFPLMPLQKIPAVPKAQGGRGCLDATDDEEILGQWARKYPRANIGLACGIPSRVVVIDLDPRNGSDESIANLAKRKQTFPPTVTAKTANGGTHFYYAYEAELKNSKSALAPGIDVKTSGGYVVAPPSTLGDGKHYRWLISPLAGDLPRLPRWASEALKPRPAPVAPAFDRNAGPRDISKLVEFVAKAGKGDRNNVLYWACCRVAEDGKLDGAAQAALLSAAIACGLDKIEAEKTIQSAAKRGKVV